MSDFNGKLYYLQKIKNALLSHLACDRGEGETENICDEWGKSGRLEIWTKPSQADTYWQLSLTNEFNLNRKFILL